MQPSADKNLVFVNPEGYFEVVLVGQQTEDSFKELFDSAKPLIDEAAAAGRPLRGLVDMTKQTGYSISSDKAALELLESISYDKMAMYNPPHKAVTEGIIMAMGRNDNTRIFTSRDEAIKWLKS